LRKYSDSITDGRMFLLLLYPKDDLTTLPFATVSVASGCGFNLLEILRRAQRRILPR
jgi:hypothetical protein